MSGVGSENDQILVATVPGIHLSGVVAATMVIAGLGVLNDVTVTQASAVWELRALQPSMRPGTLFASAMRIGRDHIASSVYTLVFAYAGSAMTILLLITAYQQSLGTMATTEEIGTEIVRTIVGAIGLVLAVPITTAFAVLMAPKGEDDHDDAYASAPSAARQPRRDGRRLRSVLVRRSPGLRSQVPRPFAGVAGILGLRRHGPRIGELTVLV